MREDDLPFRRPLYFTSVRDDDSDMRDVDESESSLSCEEAGSECNAYRSASIGGRAVDMDMGVGGREGVWT